MSFRVLPIAMMLAACGAGANDGFPSTGLPPTGIPTGDRPSDVDYGIPADFPQLNSRHTAHGLWAVDHSGAEIVPNRWVSNVDELPVYEGGGTFGAIWEPDLAAFALRFTAAADDMHVELHLPALDPGAYDVTAFGNELEYVERGSYKYTTQIGGGRGTVTIEGHNGVALWGTFSARTCFVRTPNANCFSIYAGRFSAADQRPQ